MEIKDSGDRTEFITGAVRDMHEGKGRMDLLPWEAIISVSKHCENGAKKYGEHNVDKGIPVHSFCDSAARHLAKFMSGHDDEDHLVAAAWNLLWALQMRTTHPDMVDVPYYINKEEPKIVEKVLGSRSEIENKKNELYNEIKSLEEGISEECYRAKDPYYRNWHNEGLLDILRADLSSKRAELSELLNSCTDKEPCDSNSEADLYADEEDKAAASAISSFIDAMEIKDK